MRVVYRDFKGKTATGSHAQFEKDVFGADPGIVGPVCTTANQGTCGKLATAVVTDGPAIGKPIKVTSTFPSMPTGNGRSAEALFSLWYADADGITGTNHVDIERVNSTLPLTQQGAGQNVYAYDSAAFFPMNGNGSGANDGFGDSCPQFSSTTACCTSDPDGAGTTQEQCSSRNYHFTTELRYFFQYNGGETLTFRGDDDVFVFINGRLAVDIGGVHGAYVGRVVLGDEDSSCSIQGSAAQTTTPATCTTYTSGTGSEQADNTDGRFGITKKGVYEIAFFQAERRTSISSFRLTLAGFLAPRSNCLPICGDGKVVRGEVCDDGTPSSTPPFNQPPNNGDGWGACNSTCTARLFCGDNTRQMPNEACDNGVNDDLWGLVTDGKCAPECKAPGYCGDMKIDSAFGEECDLGVNNSVSGYKGCTKQCKLGPYCGDTHVDAPDETCDNGLNDNRYGGCTPSCQFAARCGDGTVQANWGEECDGTPNCGSDCLKLGVCGDGIQQANEQCDDGVNTGAYGRCAAGCVLGPRCGDMLKQANEQCDDGVARNVGGYGKCDAHCNFGPHCGDGNVDTNNGETCDDGVNDNTYGSCTTTCEMGPRCGDAQIQDDFEECDGTANCTLDCRLGALCGNHHKDPGEECDDGVNNGAYGECAPGCVLGPRCGDGTPQGKEQCDDGKNDGGYGECAANCKLGPRCGDGKVQSEAGETCDDGNTTARDGCSATCRKEVVIMF
jgi:cysteine-rich repeat protein